MDETERGGMGQRKCVGGWERQGEVDETGDRGKWVGFLRSIYITM